MTSLPDRFAALTTRANQAKDAARLPKRLLSPLPPSCAARTAAAQPSPGAGHAWTGCANTVL